MARMTSMEALDAKIEKAQAQVSKTKDRKSAAGCTRTHRRGRWLINQGSKLRDSKMFPAYAGAGSNNTNVCLKTMVCILFV